MPLIVLLVFYALHRVQHPPPTRAPAVDAAAGAAGTPPQ
jgi:hypothetical protein